MAQTAIEWATHSWNPFTGCDRVSPGCAHCYAAELAPRLKAMGQKKYAKDGDPKTSAPGFGFTVHQDQLDNPPKFPAGARVFVNSMSDVFHEKAPGGSIAQLWRRMADQPDVNFLILTKRALRMRAWVSANNEVTVPTLPNVWLGVSIENRRFVDRADILRDTPAAVRFISAEPLLGPLVHDHLIAAGDMVLKYGWSDGKVTDDPGLDLTDIDWLIVGGESGPKHRKIERRWVEDLRWQCMDAGRTFMGFTCLSCGHDFQLLPADAEAKGESGEYDYHQPGTPYDFACAGCGKTGQVVDRTEGGTAFFFKQWGGRTPKAGGRELDGRTWDEIPNTYRGGE